MTKRNLISIGDLTDDDLNGLIARGAEFSIHKTPKQQPLQDAVVGIHFRKTSTRTRVAFSSGALRLGARIIALGPADLQTNTGESVSDTGRVLAGMVDVLVARTAACEEEMRQLGSHDTMAVVNAMSAEEHPTQALADLTTITRRFGGVEGRRILYVGEGNNTAAALALALARFPGVELELRTPPGYGLDDTVSTRAMTQAAHTSASIVERHDMLDLPKKVDIIYTTRWETTGTVKANPDWRHTFAPFQVGPHLWEHSPNALFMHDLPAHRGAEVLADVLDGPASIAFEQAWMKMHSAMAVLEWCHG